MSKTTSSYEVEDFHKEVIEASKEQPIVVDFWAPWCGPCQMLSPALEHLSEQAGDKWKLVKVNVDENQELAQQYGIRGIPMVVMFKDGEGIDSFNGVMPENKIKKWLEQHVPNATSEQAYKAYEQYKEGQVDKAKTTLERLHAKEPSNKDVRVILAKVVLFNHPSYARELTQKVHEGDEQYLKAQAIQNIADLLYFKEHPDQLEEDQVKPDFQKALKALSNKNFKKSLEHFISVINRNKEYQEEAARKGAIGIFNLLGKSHSVTQKYRKKFDMALY